MNLELENFLEENEKLVMSVKGDHNDGDYVYERTEMTSKKFKELYKAIKAIKNYEGDYNWDSDRHTMYKGFLSEDEIMDFDEYVPFGGEEGIHSIVDITISPVVEELNIL